MINAARTAPGAPAKGRILLVSLDIPPNTSLGSVRIMRFGTHLRRLGWHCRLLGSTPRPGYPTSRELIDLFGGPLPAVTIPPLPSSRGFAMVRRLLPRAMARHMEHVLAYPDPHVGWIPGALCALLYQVSTWSPDVILFTAPPWSSLFLACLTTHMTSVPVAMDIRDPWLEDPHPVARMSPRQAQWTRTIQQTLIDQAILVTVTNPHLGKLLAQRYHSRRGIACIPNAYDFNPDRIEAMPEANPKIVISHLGRIYTGLTDATPFLTAMLHGKRSGRLSSIAPLQFYGPMDETDHYVRRFSEVAAFLGPVPRASVPDRINQSHAVTLIYNGGLLRTNAKVFDYMAGKRPVLAVMPSESGATEHLAKSKTGLIVHPEDRQGIIKAAQEIGRCARAGGYPEWFQPDWRYIRRFSAANTIRALDAALCDRLHPDGHQV